MIFLLSQVGISKPLRHGFRRATSPVRRGFGKTEKFSLFAKGSPDRGAAAAGG